MPGTVDIVRYASRCLRNNPLRDPSTRSVPVYLPPSYHRSGHRRFPVLFFLPGYPGFGAMYLNRGPWQESLPQRLDRLIAQQRLPELIAVMPDCSTAYGGSQYINSPATGRYMDHIVDELVPWIDATYRTIGRPAARGVTGKSSGGYGALMLAMRRPGVFGVVGAQSSDMYFDYCLKTAFPGVLLLLDRYHGRVDRLLTVWRKQPDRLAGPWHDAIMCCAMASCYSPNPRSRCGFDLPFDPHTGMLRPAVWRRWLRWDPVMAVRRHAAALRRLHYLHLEVGSRDEYHLQYGHRMFVDTLRRLRVRHHFEEFDGGHRNIHHRYDILLPLLGRHLK